MVMNEGGTGGSSGGAFEIIWRRWTGMDWVNLGEVINQESTILLTR